MVSAPAVLVCSQDMVWAGENGWRRNQWTGDSGEVFWHRARPEDRGTSGCNRWMVLNDEKVPLDRARREGLRLCRRRGCFPI